MRVTFVQYGDYGEAYDRLAGGGEETYRHQRHSVAHAGSLLKTADDVSVICLQASQSYERDLANGVHAVGVRLWRDTSVAELVRLVEERHPSHLLVRTPLAPVLDHFCDTPVRVLPLLADSFIGGGLRGRRQNRRLSRVLRRSSLEWIANHNVTASRQLLGLGVEPGRIIPWDWPASPTPREYSAKHGPGKNGTGAGREDALLLLYVGAVLRSKGVPECIEATRLLRARGVKAQLRIVGGGRDEGYCRAQAARSGLSPGIIEFLGRLPSSRVLTLMRECDLVLVPSRRNYPEGFPIVVNEALAVRTPVVVSDHPVFEGRLVEGQGVLFFQAGRGRHLAEMVEELANNEQLYERLSRGTEQAWARLQVPVEWAGLVDRWIRYSDNDREWLRSHSLASGIYGPV